MLGRTISHYRILERIGAGGMGAVFKAQDLRLDRTVALKFLAPGLTEDPERKRRFLLEAKAAAQLDHPHICPVYEVDETDDGELFIAMAYYPGESLAARIARGVLGVDEAVLLALQVSEALAEAHRHGIVHRDVKPANILLAGDAGAKLVDFGVALWAGSDRITPGGKVAGTLRYMSPEQVRGDEVDARTDLWSLGAVVYECLSGRPAFSGSGESGTLEAILTAAPPALTDLRPQVPVDLVDVVASCLAKDRERRVPSAERLVADLRSVHRSFAAPTELERPTAGLSTPRDGARRPAPSPPADPPRAVRRRWIAAAAVVLAVVVAGAAFFAGGRGGGAGAAGEGPATLAVLPFTNLTGDGGLDYLCDGIATGLITKLSRIRGLRMISRSETWAYRDKGAEEIGRLVGAGTLLEGQVQREGDTLRVTVNLIDQHDASILWAESFEGNPDGLFGLEYRIASGLARVLAVRLSRGERERLGRDPTASSRAYDLYLRGRRALDERPGVEAAATAASHLREAVRLDPGFALAHVALSEALWRLAVERRPGAADAAEREARRALELDPDLPTARVALARALRLSGDADASIAGLQAVLADHPHPAEAERELAIGYENVGDPAQAEACLRAAVGMEPDDWSNWNALGGYLVRAGRYPAARTAYEQAARLAAPGNSWPQENLAAVRLLEGDFTAAVAAFEQLGTASADPVLASNMGTAYFFLGRLDRAEELYRRAVQLDPRNPDLHRNLADLYLRRGDDAAARASYRRALALVETSLATHPHQPRLQVDRAVLAAKVGDCAAATRGLSELWQEVSHTAVMAHDFAQAWALCGRRDAALDTLALAVDAGFSPQLIAEEDEFRSLASDARFRELTAGPRP